MSNRVLCQSSFDARRASARVRRRGSRAQLALAGVFCACAMLLLAGCGVGKIADALSKAADNLERVGTDLANGVSDLNSTAGKLGDIIRDLPKDAATELRVAVEQAAQRATQAAGIEARCTLDFARKRIADDIKHLAA